VESHTDRIGSIDKQIGRNDPAKDIKQFDSLKFQNSINKAIEEARQQQEKISENLEKLTIKYNAAKEYIKSFVIKEDNNLMIKKSRFDELINAKNETNNKIKLKSRELEYLQQQKVLLEITRGKVDILRSLEEKLRGREKALENFRPVK